MKLKEGVIIQDLGGKFVAVDASSSKDRFNGVVNMNKTAAFVMCLLKQEVTMDDVITAMTKKYDVTEQVAEENAMRFISQIKKAGLLE